MTVYKLPQKPRDNIPPNHNIKFIIGGELCLSASIWESLDKISLIVYFWKHTGWKDLDIAIRSDVINLFDLGYDTGYMYLVCEPSTRFIIWLYKVCNTLQNPILCLQPQQWSDREIKINFICLGILLYLPAIYFVTNDAYVTVKTFWWQARYRSIVL